MPTFGVGTPAGNPGSATANNSLLVSQNWRHFFLCFVDWHIVRDNQEVLLWQPKQFRHPTFAEKRMSGIAIDCHAGHIHRQTPAVNHREHISHIRLHQKRIRLPTPALKPRGEHHQKSETGASVAP